MVQAFQDPSQTLALLAGVVPLATLGLVATQGALMVVDELYCHRRRGLERLEAIGHPVDTGVFVLATAVPALLAPGLAAFALYGVLALLSCVIITKDEWLHARYCSPLEHWLHALLFVLHGPILIGLGLSWALAPQQWFLRALPLVITGWGCLQLYGIGQHVANRQTQLIRGQ